MSVMSVKTNKHGIVEGCEVGEKCQQLLILSFKVVKCEWNYSLFVYVSVSLDTRVVQTQIRAAVRGRGRRAQTALIAKDLKWEKAGVHLSMMVMSKRTLAMGASGKIEVGRLVFKRVG